MCCWLQLTLTIYWCSISNPLATQVQVSRRLIIYWFCAQAYWYTHFTLFKYTFPLLSHSFLTPITYTVTTVFLTRFSFSIAFIWYIHSCGGRISFTGHIFLSDYTIVIMNASRCRNGHSARIFYVSIILVQYAVDSHLYTSVREKEDASQTPITNDNS